MKYLINKKTAIIVLILGFKLLLVSCGGSKYNIGAGVAGTNSELPVIAYAEKDLVKQLILGQKDLSGVRLKGVNLRGFDLQNVNFSGADLSQSNLEGADLSGANLRSANLINANLKSTNLTAANLTRANLTNAVLNDTILIKTVLDSVLPTRLATNTSQKQGNSNQNSNTSEEPTLEDLIRLTTVLVYSPSTNNVGSGFFVTPKHIVTNKHVINSMRGKIYVSAQHFKTGTRAKLIATSGPESNSDDFALLELKVISNPFLKFSVSNESNQFKNVFAAGFHGDGIGLTQGQTSGNIVNTLPNVSVTKGKIIREMKFGNEKGFIFHTAPIAHGNSGGPLLDSCGNLVGVNTKVQTGSTGKESVALPTGQLSKFLFRNNISPKIVGNCVPNT